MFDHEDEYEIRRMLFDYVKSPSLRHIRDTHQLEKLAKSIVSRLARKPSIWRKWEGPREELLRAAARSWVPAEDLQAYLNDMPGPKLTLTDVVQRREAIHAEPYEHWPNKEVQAACLALYEREKADGTELPAIIGALGELVEAEERRLSTEREDHWRRRQEEERVALEQRFLSGADCKWTPLESSKALFTRKNGRAFRLSPTKDKRWELHRIENVDDRGDLIGTYGSRTDANKVLAKMAYAPEPRW